MKRYLTVLLLIFFLLTLTGCTVEADRVYTICRKTADSTYVFSGSGDFYTYIDGKVYPCLDPNLQPYPALTFKIEDGEYNITYILPGHYRGTLKSLEHYVNELVSGDFGKVEVIFADWQDLEILVTLDDLNVRILYNIRGDIRIYSSNNCAPPYLNVE